MTSLPDRPDDLTLWQPDLYQRYELLRRVLHAATPARLDRAVSIIDVGSGPERLTERAVGPGYEVTRTDVGDFDDLELVRIHPGAPLPFDDDAADVVIAMDVLEHIPEALRPGFLAECARVASQLVVVACPTDTAEVRVAEEVMATMAEEFSGKPLVFLEEHAAIGLPDDASTRDDLARSCGPVAVVRNSPVSLWAIANLADFSLNLRVPDPTPKQRFNQLMNTAPVVCAEDEPCYRMFFVGSPDRSIDPGAVARDVADELPVPSVPVIVAEAVDLLAVELGRREHVVAHLETRAAVLQLELDSTANARRSATEAHDRLASAVERLRAELDEARHELVATRAQDEHLRAVLDGRTAATSTSRTVVRRAAGKARRAAGRARRAVRRPEPSPNPPHVGVDDDLPPARFDSHWYLLRNPDAAGLDPWRHYQEYGRYEGRSPHALFDPDWYCARYPDSCADGRDPFVDWATVGLAEGRNPNEYFDTGWYLRRHPEVAAAGLDPVEHYRLHGWKEGRRPGPLFDPVWYRGTYPDVARAETDPLTHYVQFGRHEGRHANHLALVAAEGSYRPPDGLIPWFSPVNFEVDAGLAGSPRLNVLVPGLGARHLTGGPNTALQFGYRLAARGHPVRFIATDAPLDDDTAPLWSHMAAISDVGTRLGNVEVVDGSDRFRAVRIGENDVFMATAWWTAQSIKAVLPKVRHQRFLYLIQDYEPLFFASSSQYALAVETYDLDHVPIVNSRFLLDHLAAERVGRFADPAFVEAAVVFEPTVDRMLFRPAVPTAPRTTRRLLFYARPQNGLRNLFELGVAALQMAIQHEVFDEADWEFWGMGDPFEPISIGPTTLLHPLPWTDFSSYAAQMRDSDVLLSLMLAPHPSYPPLEMAACGGISVTTEFGPKTAERLAAISPNIVGTVATIEGVAQGLADAVDRLGDVRTRFDGSDLTLPATWRDVFESVLPEVETRLRLIVDDDGASTSGTAGPADRYTRWRAARLEQRRHDVPVPDLPADLTFSLLTPVWNTPPQVLRPLVDSVRSQDLGRGWEWVITDNGSTDSATLRLLEEVRHDERITVVRQETNLGILGGMASCLARAAGRYVLHLDHDDLLTPDALRVLAASLADAGWPRAFYSDEDKVRGSHFVEPFLKPDWDPVLFSNSCYVAHLCGVDRRLALEVGAYTDPATEASPDWDLFTRVALAGMEPHHVAEVLYSWRIHSTSTAGDSSVKPYAKQSHRRVLERFVEHRPDAARFGVEIHPESPDQLDWWIRRHHVDPRPLVTVVVGTQHTPRLEPLPLVDHAIHTVAVDDVPRFRDLLDDAASSGSLIHLFNPTATALQPHWYWEALGLLELHDDVVGVGGPVVRDGRLYSAGDVFGFGPWGWGSPSRGEPAHARGWFAQHHKQHSVDGLAGDHAVFEAGALRECLDAAGAGPTDLATVGALASLGAAALRRRIVYSPVLRAHVTHPFQEQWSGSGRLEIGRAAAHAASGRNRSVFLSLDPHAPFAPTTLSRRADHLARVLATEPPATVAYPEWLAERVARRAAAHPVPADAPPVSVITPVYGGTDPALLHELACCLADQTQAPSEWIIGVDGDLPRSLHDLIGRLDLGSVTVRVTGGPKHGILGTMRECLAVCTGEYVVPVDADDLLTADALAVLTSCAVAHGLPDVVYSDEDILDGATCRDPFLRPDWDPALHLSGSYVWHALLVRRETALDVGIYDEPRFEWCHDWGTVERVRRARGRIVHVPEVLYHWRRHEASSTNTDAPESAQADSVRAVFESIVADTGRPERYEIAPFPIWRGAAELHVRRRPVDAPELTLLDLGRRSDASRRSLVAGEPFPYRAIVEGPGAADPAEALVDALHRISTPLVFVLDGAAVVGGDGAVWEAVKWFELLSDTALVCGRSVDVDGRLRAGAEVEDPEIDDRLLHPLEGRTIEDPGPYALALKPHSVSVAEPRCMVADRRRLIDALEDADGARPSGSLGAVIGRSLARRGWRIVYTPLLSVTVPGEPFPLDPVSADAARVRRGLGPVTASSRWFS
jgi:glycosyltransferase involved in cell wall biosynthesis